MRGEGCGRGGSGPVVRSRSSRWGGRCPEAGGGSPQQQQPPPSPAGAPGSPGEQQLQQPPPPRRAARSGAPRARHAAVWLAGRPEGSLGPPPASGMPRPGRPLELWPGWSS